MDVEDTATALQFKAGFALIEKGLTSWRQHSARWSENTVASLSGTDPW